MLLLQGLQAAGCPFQFCLCSGPVISLRNIAPGAFELDLSAAAGTLVLKLHFIVANHPVDQLVPGDHPLAGALQFRSFLGGDLWSALAGIHMHYSRSIFRTGS